MHALKLSPYQIALLLLHYYWNYSLFSVIRSFFFSRSTRLVVVVELTNIIELQEAVRVVISMPNCFSFSRNEHKAV